MAYKRQNFADGDLLTADKLNQIEDGIVANEENASKSVKFEYQLLSETQKAQVRANIGALGQSNLESATNTALAKAKASGEFDGKDGENGRTPIKGIDYFNEADKNEIVQAVLKALPSAGLTEMWTFTMDDGSEIQKEVLVV